MIGSIKIVSGGQTGADLGAVDAAKRRGIECGGWCPKGRINETGKIDDKYDCFKEVTGDFSTDTDNYAARTVQNIIDSDGTLIIVPEWPLPENIKDGTLLTIKSVETNIKPHLIVDVSKMSPDKLEQIDRWIKKNGIKTLNVAGPRESNSPGIYESSIKLIDDVISYIEAHNADESEPMNFRFSCCCAIV